jgi:hypothetical protein
MDERRMLELAARAAGYEIHPTVEGRDCLAIKDPKGYWGSEHLYWNPLTDDGDAFRLAVSIGFHRNMIIEIGVGGVCVDVGHPHVEADEFQDPQAASFDPYAATRRAIVRAAAAIGEKMEEQPCKS